MINPTATACIATSVGIPNSEHAIGISKSEPPTTPEAPQAAKVETIHKIRALGKSIPIPNV